MHTPEEVITRLIVNIRYIELQYSRCLRTAASTVWEPDFYFPLAFGDYRVSGSEEEVKPNSNGKKWI